VERRACRHALTALSLHHSREPHPPRKEFFKDQNSIFSGLEKLAVINCSRLVLLFLRAVLLLKSSLFSDLLFE